MMVASDALACSALELIDLYRTRRTSPVEITPAVLRRIDPLNPFSGAAYLLRHFTDQQRALVDPGLLEVADEGARISMMELLEAAQLRDARVLCAARAFESVQPFQVPDVSSLGTR